jgi:hypothetical protein
MGSVRVLILASATTLLASGCSARAVAFRVVAASDIAADGFADAWETATDLKIQSCAERLGSSSTREQREECLGPFAPSSTEKALVAMRALVAAQRAVKEAAQCEEFRSCVGRVDWQALAKQVQGAWSDLRPFIQVVKGSQDVP